MRQFNNIANSVIRFAIAVFTACALNAHAQPDTPNSIQSLKASSTSGGELVIKVEMKNALTKLPAGFIISTPPRIAFDFPDTVNGLGKSTYEFSEGALRSANIVQAGNRTRLVVNLNQMLAYDTRVDGNNLIITLQGKAETAAAGAVSHFAEAKPAAQKYSLRDIDFLRGKNGEGRIQIDLSDAGVGIDIKQQGKSLIVDFTKTSLPHNLQRKLDVTDFGTPVESIDTFAQGDDVRMVIEPKGLWEQAAYQMDNKFIVEIKPIADASNKLVKSGQVGYSGEKLTLNFQNISVREALYVLGDFINSSGISMNMIISDTVGGNLTLRLKDVPWDQALDIILQNKGLDKRLNGNVMQIAPRDELAAKEKINLASRQEIADLEPVHTESFQLSYQKGDAVAAMLTNKDQRILSKRGSAVVDARTNTLFVQDTASRLEEARKLIRQIDVPVRQVMIEARFVAARDEFTRSLGGKLSYSNINGPVPGQGQWGGGIGLGHGSLAIPTAQTTLPAISPNYGNLSLSLFNAAATKFLNLELNAAEIDGTSKNIASPRVVTADSTEASITQGKQIPYQTSSQNGTQTTFKDANLSLKVTPQITPDDRVNMKVEVNDDAQGSDTTAGPVINTNKVTTQVLVENGGTVVIGGVYTQDVSDTIDKVPLFGDVPVLGWLFKNDLKKETKSELLVFITPKILKDSLSLH